jgi:AraC family transcriptional activator of mtrCDE
VRHVTRNVYEALSRQAGLLRLDLLTDLRVSLAANELKKPAISIEAVAETVGYQSVSAFRRVFAERMGMTPAEWRRLARSGEQSGVVRDLQVSD